MTEPLTPEVIESLAAGYVLDNLDRAEAAVFEQLLAQTPDLGSKVDRLQTTLYQVVYSLNRVEPPPHLQSAILAAATQTFQPFQPKPSRPLWEIAMGSVAALLILYLGIDNYRLRQDFQIAQGIHTLLQQSQTQLFSLKAVNASDPATGSFVVNLGQRQGILTVQDLMAPPPGKIYRLWAIADGEKIPCGTLKLNSQGEVLDKFWMPADLYGSGISGLFVTLESSETSRYPSGAIVMESHSSTQI